MIEIVIHLAAAILAGTAGAFLRCMSTKQNIRHASAASVALFGVAVCEVMLAMVKL